MKKHWKKIVAFVEILSLLVLTVGCIVFTDATYASNGDERVAYGKSTKLIVSGENLYISIGDRVILQPTIQDVYGNNIDINDKNLKIEWYKCNDAYGDEYLGIASSYVIEEVSENDIDGYYYTCKVSYNGGDTYYADFYITDIARYFGVKGATLYAYVGDSVTLQPIIKDYYGNDISLDNENLTIKWYKYNDFSGESESLGEGSSFRIEEVQESDFYSNYVMYECCVYYNGVTRWAQFYIDDINNKPMDVEVLRSDFYYDSEGELIYDLVLMSQDKLMQEGTDYEIEYLGYNDTYESFDIIIKGKGSYTGRNGWGISDNHDIVFVTEDGKWRVNIPSDGNSPRITAYLGDEETVTIPQTVTVPDYIGYDDTEVTIGSVSSGTFANCQEMVTLNLGNVTDGLSEYMVIECPRLQTIIMNNSGSWCDKPVIKTENQIITVKARVDVQIYEYLYDENHDMTSITHSMRDYCEAVDLLYEPVPITGISGDLEWKIDSDGLLTITGVGDYEERDWLKYTDLITEAKVDVSGITNICGMFASCVNLKEVDIVNLDTSNVTDMHSMFMDCSSLTSIDLSNFDTRNVENMAIMFYNCSSLTEINLKSFDTENVTSMGVMFYGCSSLKELDLSGFDMSKVTYSENMITGCTGLTRIKNPINFKSDLDVNLPEGLWKDSQNNKYVCMPQNLSYSVELIKYEEVSTDAVTENITTPSTENTTTTQVATTTSKPPVESVTTMKTATTKSNLKKPKKVSSLKIKKVSTKKVKLSWKKVKGVSGYQIMYAQNKKFTKSIKKITVKGSVKNKTISKLKSKKKYYFKVRAYKKAKGKKVYGEWSKVKVIKL